MPTAPVKTSGEVPFIPIKGRRASIIQEQDDSYLDVTILELYRGGKVLIEYDDKSQETVPTGLLEPPLEADVNERFAYFSQLARLVFYGKLKSLFVTGEGGLGKSFTLQEVVTSESFAELGDGKMGMVPTMSLETGEPLMAADGVTPVEHEEEIYDFVRIKGYSTARALFDFLEMHKSKMVVIEDCDSALTDPTAQNIFKAILDTIEKRKVNWLTKQEHASFEFTGSVVFLSNLAKAKINQAIISRSVVVDLEMTKEEVIERMSYIMPTLEAAEGLTVEEQNTVLNIIDKYKHTIKDLNIRTLVKSLTVFKETKNIALCRYSILNN